MTSCVSKSPDRRIGRYMVSSPFASGGMATVHFGRLVGAAGFSRIVAIKRLRDDCARDPKLMGMLIDEARIAARIRHPNVAAMLDVLTDDGDLSLVMEYVHGESLAGLLRRAHDSGSRMPAPIAAAIAMGVLHGLHAAHEASSEQGAPLNIVHRDVSPQNILVGADGVARVVDFGVAKALGRAQTTHDGALKGKFSYMSPEQIQGAVTRQTDVYATSVVLWEALTGVPLFTGDSAGEIVNNILSSPVSAPSRLCPDLPPQLDSIVLRGLERDPTYRFSTAREMAMAIEQAGVVASTAAVGEWVEAWASPELHRLACLVADVERWPVDDSAGSPGQGGLRTVDLSAREDKARAESSTSRKLTLANVLAALGMLTAVVALALVMGLIRKGEATSIKAEDKPHEAGESMNQYQTVGGELSLHSPAAGYGLSPKEPPAAASTAPQGSESRAETPALSSTSPARLPPTRIPASTRPSSSARCVPPGYRFDATGKKIWDPECLQ